MFDASIFTLKVKNYFIGSVVVKSFEYITWFGLRSGWILSRILLDPDRILGCRIQARSTIPSQIWMHTLVWSADSHPSRQ